MWKFILLGVAIYFLYRLFANDFLKKKKIDAEKEKAENEQLIAKGEMVKDPACGSYILKDGALSVKDGDKTWYFCSYDCRENFLEKLGKGADSLPEKVQSAEKEK